MSWPDPRPGLVIRYSYLWNLEAEAGREEGKGSTLCRGVGNRGQAGVHARHCAPITHSAPQAPDEGIEVPPETKARLGLDDERSWIIVSEANDFIWPGPDLRFLPRRGPESAVYGFLPPGLFRMVRDRFLVRARAGRSGLVLRTK